MNKKLKTLCLGTLLGASLFGFTGCDLLSSKTEETATNNQLTLEEARALLELAVYKLNVNKDGILNNLIENYSYKSSDKDNYEISNTYVYVDSDNNTYVFETEISSTGVEELTRAVYDTKDKGTMEFYIDDVIDTSNGNLDYKEKYILEQSENYGNALAAYAFAPNLGDIIISSVDTLENGNYSIVFILISENTRVTDTRIYTAEITKDAKIISLEFDSNDYYTGDKSYVKISSGKNNYKYNEITTAKFQEFMTFINNHKNTFKE